MSTNSVPDVPFTFTIPPGSHGVSINLHLDGCGPGEWTREAETTSEGVWRDLTRQGFVLAGNRVVTSDSPEWAVGRNAWRVGEFVKRSARTGQTITVTVHGPPLAPDSARTNSRVAA